MARRYTIDGSFVEGRTLGEPMTRRTVTKINIHPPTRDSVMVTDSVANGALRTALFRPGTRAVCKCAAGECAPDECNELWIYDAEGNRIACFYGREFRATNETESVGGVSGLCVYKMPKATSDAAIDKAVLQIRQRLADINAANARFWAPPADEATE